MKFDYAILSTLSVRIIDNKDSMMKFGSLWLMPLQRYVVVPIVRIIDNNDSMMKFGSLWLIPLPIKNLWKCQSMICWIALARVGWQHCVPWWQPCVDWWCRVWIGGANEHFAGSGEVLQNGRMHCVTRESECFTSIRLCADVKMTTLWKLQHLRRQRT